METALIIISIVLLVATVGFLVWSYFNNKKTNVNQLIKESEELFEQTEQALDKALKQTGFTKEEIEAGMVMCEFCGAHVHKDAYKCPKCGKTRENV